MNKKNRENLSLLLFVAPALIVYIIFKLYPAISGFYYALTDWSIISKHNNFVGLDNFVEILHDKAFWKSLVFTTKYVIVMVIMANLIALSLAVTIESRGKTKGFFRTVFYMPNMISMIIGGFMWNFIFTKVLYYLADNYGMKFLDRSWIGNTNNAFVAIIIVACWGAVGYIMIIYMAALQSVPAQLLEAASLDGANAWQNFKNVTVPLIQNAFTICLFWTLSTAFQVFDVIYSLTGGGPARQTESAAINIYEEAFRLNNRFGYATAKSLVLFLVIFIITLIQLSVMKRKELEL